MNSWVCEKCGYKLKADAPPEICPSCKNKCTFVDNACYTPDCAGQDHDPRITGKL
ncbi:rubredoxin-like domain-containing protein [Desulfocicer niacini]